MDKSEMVYVLWRDKRAYSFDDFGIFTYMDIPHH